jgi:hypothetical protein
MALVMMVRRLNSRSTSDGRGRAAGVEDDRLALPDHFGGGGSDALLLARMLHFAFREIAVQVGTRPDGQRAPVGAIDKSAAVQELEVAANGDFRLGVSWLIQHQGAAILVCSRRPPGVLRSGRSCVSLA